LKHAYIVPFFIRSSTEHIGTLAVIGELYGCKFACCRPMAYFGNGISLEFLHWAGRIFKFQNGNSRWPWCNLYNKSPQMFLSSAYTTGTARQDFTLLLFNSQWCSALASCTIKLLGKILHWLTAFLVQVTSQKWRHCH